MSSWLRQSEARFEELRAQYAGQTFLVLGNGPSLDTVRGEDVARFATIACNNAWRMRGKWGRDAALTLMTDRTRLVEFAREQPELGGQLVIGDHRAAAPSENKWSGFRGRGALCIRQLVVPFFERHPQLIPLTRLDSRVFDLICDKRRMSFDFGLGFNFGHSVVIAGVQLAVALGAKRVLLCGCDSRSTQGAYFSLMPSQAASDPTFLKNPRIQVEPYLALLRATLDPLEIELIDCSPGGAITSLKRGALCDF